MRVRLLQPRVVGVVEADVAARVEGEAVAVAAPVVAAAERLCNRLPPVKPCRFARPQIRKKRRVEAEVREPVEVARVVAVAADVAAANYLRSNWR